MGYGINTALQDEEFITDFKEVRDTYVRQLASGTMIKRMYKTLCPECPIQELQQLSFSWFIDHREVLFDETPCLPYVLFHAGAFAEAMGVLLRKEQGDNE